MKVLFGIMSAIQPAATLQCLIDALGTRRILVHHDWSQQPGLRVSGPSMAYVEDPARTGWADWGFTRGILRLLEYALECERFDYFQLLSPTCMPIRPLEEFEGYLASTRPDFLIDAVELQSEPNVLMSHGWRAFAKKDSVRQRLLRRARSWYFGDEITWSNRSGIAFPVESKLGSGGLAGARARIGYDLTRLAADGVGFAHPFGPQFPCFVGSTWFTAAHDACAYLVEKARQSASTVAFERMHLADEMFFPSLMMNSGLRCRPAAHYISRFVDARPTWLDVPELHEAIQSGAYFARKFPEDPQSPARVELRSILRQREDSGKASATPPISPMPQ